MRIEFKVFVCFEEQKVRKFTKKRKMGLSEINCSNYVSSSQYGGVVGQVLVLEHHHQHRTSDNDKIATKKKMHLLKKIKKRFGLGAYHVLDIHPSSVSLLDGFQFTDLFAHQIYLTDLSVCQHALSQRKT